MNAIAFISIGWLLIATYKGVRLLKSKMSQVLSPTHP